jgi:hypothetical protein
MARWDRDRVPVGMRDPSRRGQRLIKEQTAYLALVNAGIGVREAARTVGITYATAKTWKPPLGPPLPLGLPLPVG